MNWRGEFIMRTYQAQLEVRGYELDSYGHVNHAVYPSYLEQARWKMLQQEDISLKTFAEWKRWPVVAEIRLQYKRPTFMGDLLDIETRVVECGKVHFLFAQTIRRGAEIVLEGEVKAVIVNESGRAASIPDEMKARFGFGPTAGSQSEGRTP